MTTPVATAGRRQWPVARRVLPFIAAGLLVTAAALASYVLWPLPAGLASSERPSGIRIEDRDGRLLRTTRSDDGSLQRWTNLDDMDPDIIAAFLAVEDHRFFRHHGIDVRAAVRAARDNLHGGRAVSGASTITMQLARLYFGTPRNWTGKVGQVLQAWRLEWHLDKQTILEEYLNRVPMGQGAIGVPGAALLYFDRSAHEVSLGQAALLAALARAPSGSNPIVSLDRARIRRRVGLGRLQALGYATAEDVRRAEQEPLRVAPDRTPFLAPHFTSRILAWEEEKGSLPAGVRRTTLDLDLQSAIEAEVRHTVQLLGHSGVRHAAAVVLDNRTGEILAWVGSPDFWADTAGQVDMVVSPRQPGSALKPFLYGLAFDRGYTAASVLPDIAHAYATSVGPYRPRNYDRRFHGPVRVREALASSYNVPAVELTERLGAPALLRTLHAAGFESLRHSPGYYGLGLALGNGDVTLLEMANAYRALANDGQWTPYRWRSLEGAGAIPLEPGRPVMTRQAASLVLSILADPVARIPGFGLHTPFDFPFPVATKTGTSRHFTDNWAVGTTGNFTVAVWAGDFSGRPMDRVSGITGAGPLLQRVVMHTSRRYDPGVLPAPAEAGAIPEKICLLSGQRAGPRCPHQVEWFVAGTEPGHQCDWHRPSGVVLPAMYHEWAEQSGLAREVYAANAFSVVDNTQGAFRITSPADGDRYRVPPGVESNYATIALRAVGGSGGGAVRWTVNGETLLGGRWVIRPGKTTFVARALSGEADTVTVEVAKMP